MAKQINKKPIYKKWWFWVPLIIVFILASYVYLLGNPYLGRSNTYGKVLYDSGNLINTPDEARDVFDYYATVEIGADSYPNTLVGEYFDEEIRVEGWLFTKGFLVGRDGKVYLLRP